MSAAVECRGTDRIRRRRVPRALPSASPRCIPRLRPPRITGHSQHCKDTDAASAPAVPETPAAPQPCHQSHLASPSLHSHCDCDRRTQGTAPPPGPPRAVGRTRCDRPECVRVRGVRLPPLLPPSLVLARIVASGTIQPFSFLSSLEYRIGEDKESPCGRVERSTDYAGPANPCGLGYWPAALCGPTDATRPVTYCPARPVARHKSGASLHLAAGRMADGKMVACGPTLSGSSVCAVCADSVTARAISHGPHDRWDDARHRWAWSILDPPFPRYGYLTLHCCVCVSRRRDAAYHTGSPGIN